MRNTSNHCYVSASREAVNQLCLGILISAGAAPAPTADATAAFSGISAAPVFLATSTRRPVSAAVPSAAFSTFAATHAPSASWPWTSTRNMKASEIQMA